MKKIASIMLLSSAFVFTACDMKKTSETSVVTADSTAVAAPEAAEEAAATIVTVKGTVSEVQQGKDGVSVKVKDEDGKFYTIVISMVNLKDKDMYRPVKVGDVITVNGEQWEMDGETHIKAHTLAI